MHKRGQRESTPLLLPASSEIDNMDSGASTKDSARGCGCDANTWKKYGGEFAVTVFLLVYGLGMTALDPLIAKSRWWMAGAGGWRPTVVTTLWVGLCLAQSIGVAWASTNTLKNVAGRQRPGFFDMTDYAGYSDALDTGSYTTYNADTTFGRLGAIAKGRASSANMKDAQRSFPSGHASLAFAGMCFLVGYFRWLLRVPAGKWFTFRAFISCAPLIVAAFVSISRVRDRKHNPDDISVGAVLGLIGGYMAWSQFNSEIESRDLIHPPHTSLNNGLNNSAANTNTPVVLKVQGSIGGAANGDPSNATGVAGGVGEVAVNVGPAVTVA